MSEADIRAISERTVRIETLLEGITERDADTERRLRRVEKILWIGIGFATAAGSTAGSIVGTWAGP